MWQASATSVNGVGATRAPDAPNPSLSGENGGHRKDGAVVSSMRPPAQPDDPRGDRALPGNAGLLPAAPTWVPLLALWPSVDETLLVTLAAAYDDAPRDWEECVALLRGSGIVEPGAADERTVAVSEAWRKPIDDAFSALVDAPAMDAWFSRTIGEERQGLLIGIEGWARRSARWDVLSDLWHVISTDAAALTDAALLAFLDTPAEARKDYPVLSWASAMADASAARPPKSPVEAFLGRLVLDSALLHADWALREETDEAVIAGTMRMVGERWLPPSGRPLDAAWRTKSDVEAFLDERSRLGRPPGRFAHSFFRAMSALLALVRADLRESADEARWAAILASQPPVTTLAAAVEALAHSLAGAVEAADGTEPPTPAEFRFGGLSQMAAVMVALARGRTALQRLDRQGVEEALAVVTPDMAAVVGLWVPLITLRAFHAALWGDPADGLNRLLAAVARQPLVAREEDQPAGAILLARAREFLFSRVGAFGAALTCADGLPELYRVASQARARLWAGQPGLAVRAAEAILPNPQLLVTDRQQLLLIRGAATALDGRVPEDIRFATESAMREILETGGYLPLAMLPAPARNAVIGMSGQLAADPATRESFVELRGRLSGIGGAGSGGRGLFHLTERESILLPLLATDLTVPQIAARLNVSANTIRKQVSTLREKFEASSRAELIRKASTHGAIT